MKTSPSNRAAGGGVWLCIVAVLLAATLVMPSQALSHALTTHHNTFARSDNIVHGITASSEAGTPRSLAVPDGCTEGAAGTSGWTEGATGTSDYTKGYAAKPTVTSESSALMVESGSARAAVYSMQLTKPMWRLLFFTIVTFLTGSFFALAAYLARREDNMDVAELILTALGITASTPSAIAAARMLMLVWRERAFNMVVWNVAEENVDQDNKQNAKQEQNVLLTGNGGSAEGLGVEIRPQASVAVEDKGKGGKCTKPVNDQKVKP
eukprot:GHVS01035613.1.p1 GENE.GHVS01035613.1~~GHVS01035613.1.p1  ORF type:complete len:266 (-),score=44.47 GHVS01035613.1:189-986(-)